VCALYQGQTAHDKLETKPTSANAEAACNGVITVILIHYSQSLNANWPCVFQKNDTTIQPTIKTLDSLPKVVTYYGGFIEGDVAGYRYMDVYTFAIPKDWHDSASLVYADESGNHHTFNIDFALFAKDVASR